MISYRDLLLDELRKRQVRNVRYSLRAFARALDMDPSTLSKILRGKRSLSMRKAFDLALRLQLSNDMANAFMASVAKEAQKKEEVIEEEKDQDPTDVIDRQCAQVGT